MCLPPFHLTVAGRVRHCGLRIAALLGKAWWPFRGRCQVGTLWAFHLWFFTLVAELPFSCCLAGFAFARAGPEQALAGL